MAEETKSMEPGTNHTKPMTILQAIGMEDENSPREPHEFGRMTETRSFDVRPTHTGMDHYLGQVRAARRLGRDEELALFERWQKHGDLEARRVLLLANLRAVAAIAFKSVSYTHLTLPTILRV